MGYEVSERRLQCVALLHDFLPVDFINDVLDEYALNDRAHREDHVVDVVSNADLLINNFKELRWHRKSILLAALLHDVKCHVNRELHHINAALAVYREYLEPNPNIRVQFGSRDITIIERCVLEHRASWKPERYNNASEAVAAADRGVPDYSKYIMRAINYRMKRIAAGEEIRTIALDVIEHMRDKFGEDGYAWGSVPKYTKLMYKDEIRNIIEKTAEPVDTQIEGISKIITALR